MLCGAWLAPLDVLDRFRLWTLADDVEESGPIILPKCGDCSLGSTSLGPLFVSPRTPLAAAGFGGTSEAGACGLMGGEPSVKQ